MFRYIESMTGTMFLMTAGYVLVTVLYTAVALYLVLWFFKKPIRHHLTFGLTRKIDAEYVVFITCMLFMCINVATMGQISEPYKPFLIWVVGIPVVLAVIIYWFIRLLMLLSKVRSRIPGED